MKIVLLVTTTILSFAICESAWACPSGQTQDPITGHCIKIQSSCGGKCTFYYDTTTHDVIFEKNADVPDGEEVIIPAEMYRGITGYSPNDEDRTVRNVTIGEGITGMEKWAFATYGGYHMGTAGSTLKLPSTYKYQGVLHDGSGDFWNVGFGTIDISAVKDNQIFMPVDGDSNSSRTVIIDPNSNAVIEFMRAYDPNSAYTVNIVCKGEKSKCDEKVVFSYVAPKQLNKGTISYYAGDDGNGHWEEWSDNGKAVYADSSKSKLLGKYAFDGTQTGSYKYDGAGNLVQAYENGKLVYAKKIYTPAEAAAATHDGNDNTVSITW